MFFPALFFYLFAGVCLASAFMVIAARNPVHSVMILIVVYVGAVAVLFLFVVLMLDVDFVELRQGFLNYLPVGVTVGLIFLIELALVAGAWVISPTAPRALATPITQNTTNTEALGLVLYTR